MLNSGWVQRKCTMSLKHLLCQKIRNNREISKEHSSQIEITSYICDTVDIKINIDRAGCGVHTCNPSTQEGAAGGLPVGGLPRLHNKFQDSVDYTAKPCHSFIHKQTNN
jgi:hypothetical protein